LSKTEASKNLRREVMKVVTFSAHSDSYLDAEESKKDMFAKYLRDAGSAFIAIKLKFKVRAELSKTEDGLEYQQESKIPIVNTLKDNIINVVFSKCDYDSNVASDRRSELFLRMMPVVALAYR
jgi:hypothetical protein